MFELWKSWNLCVSKQTYEGKKFHPTIILDHLQCTTLHYINRSCNSLHGVRIFIKWSCNCISALRHTPFLFFLQTVGFNCLDGLEWIPSLQTHFSCISILFKDHHHLSPMIFHGFLWSCFYVCNFVWAHVSLT